MSQVPQSVIIHPVGNMSGTIEVPGDKSISHRVAMLASLASGTSRVRHFLHSEDCVNTLRAMEAMGARSFVSEEGDLCIQGTGGKVMEPAGPLNVGNSGTSIRLLSGIIAAHPVTVEITGDESLCSRPMGRIKEPLERMGATVELTGERGTAPVKIRGAELKAIDYTLPVASAQVKSCVLLAGLYAEGRTTVTEPVLTRDHTERLLLEMGVPVHVDGLHVSVDGCGLKGPVLKARDFTVPGDFSSAAYWLLAAAARKKGEVTIKRVGLNPRRTAFLDVLRKMGADVEVDLDKATKDGEPIGDIHVSGAALKGVEVGGKCIPNMIDELPLVAVAGALASGKTTIRNAKELRVKESDRIVSMASNLRLFGVEVEELEDGMVITGGADLRPTGPVKSYGDHRNAMAMAILGCFAKERTVINNVSCVDTSYPEFWDHLRKLGGHVE